LRVQDWKALNRVFFWALETERRAMFLLLCLIVIVAAFNIVSILTMKVMERTKEIGVLKSLGATEGSVLAVFVCEGLSLGLSGTLVGFGLGVPLCWLADHYRWIEAGADLYNLSYLPFRLEAGNLLAVALASVLISLTTTLYPSWQASRLEPVKAMWAE
jgi:lipoprotein-releasing system permease protein